MDYTRERNCTISNNATDNEVSLLGFQPISSHLNLYRQENTIFVTHELEQVCYNILMVMGSLNVVANLPILLFILYHGKKLLKRHTTKYFINIQLTHIIFGGKIIFTSTSTSRSNITVAVSKILLAEMILSMLIMNCDRYFAISKPFIYQKMTSKKSYLLIAVSWLLTWIEFILLIVLNLKRQLVLNLSFTILMTVSITVLTYSNIVIWFIAKKHINSIAQNSLNKPVREQIRRQQLKKSTLSCLVVVGSFVVLYTPYLIHNIIVMATEFKARISNAFTFSVMVISLMHGIVDPFLYVIFNGETKSELVSSLPFLKKKRTEHVEMKNLRCRDVVV